MGAFMFIQADITDPQQFMEYVKVTTPPDEYSEIV